MLEILRNRRSIRQFAKRPIEKEKTDLLIEALLRSPSSRGRNPWEFLVVYEPGLLQKLGQAKEHGSTFLAEAPMAVVIMADPEKTDVWIEDCSIAAIILQLAATSLGLGSCWAQVRLRSHNESCSTEDFIKKLLDIPENMVVECIIGLGYPAEQKPPHSFESLLTSKVHFDYFNR